MGDLLFHLKYSFPGTLLPDQVGMKGGADGPCMEKCTDIHPLLRTSVQGMIHHGNFLCAINYRMVAGDCQMKKAASDKKPWPPFS
jgi:hypothetical protein